MKTKKIIPAAITLIMVLSFITTSAWAGSKQRHRWEGVAIGVGAAIVGGRDHQQPCLCPPRCAAVAVSVNYVEYNQPAVQYRDHYQPRESYRCYKKHSHKDCTRNHYRPEKCCRYDHGRSHHNGRH